MSSKGDSDSRYGRTKVCDNCNGVVIVVRHIDDGAKTAKEVKTADIRLLPMHRADAGELVEAATNQREFNHILSTFVCNRKQVVR